VNVDRLIHQIEKALHEGAPTPHLEELAKEYASCRATIKERLDKCVFLIRTEKHHAALDVAESPPSLFSLLEKLACESEEPWQRLCESRGLGIGPGWRQEQVDLLESAYRKENSEDSPIFREYREAVSNRDDPLTFQILKSILANHPGHAASKKHYLQLGRKLLDDKIAELESLLREGREQEFLDLLQEAETADWGVEPSGEKWNQLLAARDAFNAPPPITQTAEEEGAPPAGPSQAMESLKAFGNKVFGNLRNLDLNGRRWIFGGVIAIALMTLGLHPALLVALAIYWPFFKLKLD